MPTATTNNSYEPSCNGLLAGRLPSNVVTVMWLQTIAIKVASNPLFILSIRYGTLVCDVQRLLAAVRLVLNILIDFMKTCSIFGRSYLFDVI